jgi:hypothetical protein
MANLVLFRSSVVLGILNLFALFFLHTPRLLRIVVSSGVLTSILNHGLTIDTIKYADRLMMVVGFLADIYLLQDLPRELALILLGMVLSAVILWIFAKVAARWSSLRIGGNLPHIAAHICLATVHLFMFFGFHAGASNTLNNVDTV